VVRYRRGGRRTRGVGYGYECGCVWEWMRELSTVESYELGLELHSAVKELMS
jgi:hypothetical protein